MGSLHKVGKAPVVEKDVTYTYIRGDSSQVSSDSESGLYDP